MSSLLSYRVGNEDECVKGHPIKVKLSTKYYGEQNSTHSYPDCKSMSHNGLVYWVGIFQFFSNFEIAENRFQKLSRWLLTLFVWGGGLIQPPPMVFWTSSKLCECWRLAVSWLFKFGYCGPLGTKILMIPQSWRPQVTFKEGQFTQKMVKKRYLPPLPPPTAWETGGL